MIAPFQRKHQQHARRGGGQLLIGVCLFKENQWRQEEEEEGEDLMPGPKKTERSVAFKDEVARRPDPD